MKKVISTSILICCMVLSFISCNSENQDIPSVTESAAEVMATPVTTEKTSTTTLRADSSYVTTSSKKTDELDTVAENQVPEKKVKNQVPEKKVESPVSDKKIEKYKKEETVYYDEYQMMCANLTFDEDGYHLAMTFDKEYDSENINWFVTFEDFGESVDSYIVLGDGSQIESDNITVTGCLECLRILDVSKDGKRAYDLALYPINNLPGNTSPKKDLDSFFNSGTLDKYERKDWFYNDTMPDFLDDNQKKLFANAEYIIVNLTGSTKFYYNFDEKYTLGNNWLCHPTGMSFRSFIDYSETIFTPQFSAALFDAYDGFYNICGELCVVDSGKGTSSLYTGRTFELISENDNEIKFKLIGHYSYKDICSPEDYNNMPKDERDYDKEYTFTMNNTPSGWRFSEFNYWR